MSDKYSLARFKTGEKVGFKHAPRTKYIIADVAKTGHRFVYEVKGADGRLRLGWYHEEFLFPWMEKWDEEVI